jgi:hypothetical protein
MVGNIYNPSIQEGEAGGNPDFEVSLGYLVRPGLKIKTQETKPSNIVHSEWSLKFLF